MKRSYRLQSFPASRIASFDVYAVSMRKHHVHGLLELDVTKSREKIRELRKKGEKVSFNAWLLKVIASSLVQHPEAAAYLVGKKRLILFSDINISMLVEKKLGDQKVPIPIVLEKVNEKNLVAITDEIEEAKSQTLSDQDVVLGRRAKRSERFYYLLPGFLRRAVWKYMLKHPKVAYGKMGNVSVTSLGMMGRINGWFIHRSIHPVSFGVGSVLKKPVVINNEIQVREILNMTVLLDHDVLDGAPMVRFLNSLNTSIENGAGLSVAADERE